MKALITGANGKLGPYVVGRAMELGWEVEAWSGRSGGLVQGVPLKPVDLAQLEELPRHLEASAPQAIIHCAAMSVVADCFREPERALRVNAEATGVLSDWSKLNGVRFLFVSTDMVFDGEAAPYSEDSPVGAPTAYARSKIQAEQAVARNPEALTVRVALMFGLSRSGPGFFDHLYSKLRAGQAIQSFHDEWRTPLYYDDAAWALCRLATGDAAGLLHLGGPERLSRLEMARHVAQAIGAPLDSIQPISRHEGNFAEPRARDLSLKSTRVGLLLPDLRTHRLGDVFAKINNLASTAALKEDMIQP